MNKILYILMNLNIATCFIQQRFETNTFFNNETEKRPLLPILIPIPISSNDDIFIKEYPYETYF